MLELIILLCVAIYIVGFYVYKGVKSAKKKGAVKLRDQYYMQQEMARQFIMHSGDQEAIETYSNLMKRKRFTNKSLRRAALKKKNKYLAAGFALATGLALLDVLIDGLEDMIEAGELEPWLNETLHNIGIDDGDFSQLSEVKYDGQDYLDDFNPVTMVNDLSVWTSNADMTFGDVADSWGEGDFFDGGDSDDGDSGGDE
jgi:hypothetical protein